MSHRPFFHALGLTVILVTPAFGQNPEPSRERQLQKWLERFPEADANRDGKLTPDEAQAYRAKMRPLVGAIRWDAWQDRSSVQQVVTKTLTPCKWRWRQPFFTTVNDKGEVSFDAGNTQQVMDQEIAHAHQAGLDYWAFVTYPANLGMSNGLKLYLSSAHKSDIKFVLNLQGGWLAREDWAPQVQRYVALFQDVDYVKVLDGRPLVYLYDAKSMLGEGFADWNAARAAIDLLRQATRQADLGEPYLVVQGWHPAGDHANAQRLGANAIGAYALGGGTLDGAPYADLTQRLHASWDARKATGAQVVPLVSAGWDRRPRVDNPTPWEAGPGSAGHFLALTPPQLTAHLTDAMAWTHANRAAAPANAILIYAWNEHDEGGWVCPTRNADGSTDTSRIDALKQAIDAFVP